MRLSLAMTCLLAISLLPRSARAGSGPGEDARVEAGEAGEGESEESQEGEGGEGDADDDDDRAREDRARRIPRGEADPRERVIEVSTGTRTKHDAATAPVATTVITRQDIVDSGAEDLSELLEQSDASIQTTEGVGGTELSLRGFDTEQVLILIDGQRVTGRVNGTIDLSRFTVENIERVEVVQGAGSVLHGSDAVGGVVNIITRQPEPGVQGEAHAAYGSRNTVDASGRISGGMRRWQLSGFGGYHRTDGWDADPSDEATTGDQVSTWNAGLSGNFRPVEGLRLGIAGTYLRRDSRGTDVNTSNAILDRRNLSETADTTLSVDWSGADSHLRGTLHYNLFHDQFRQDQRGDDALDQYQPTVDQLVQADLQYDQMVGRHVFTTGLDVQAEWLRTDRIAVDTAASDLAERQRVAIFVQDEWTPSLHPRITVLPALRLDYDSRFGLYPTGRLALLAAPLETLTFRVSYGRGYRAPGFREMYLLFANSGVGYRVQGNPALQPEQAWTLDLGMSWLPREDITVRVGVFDNQLRDLITVDLVETGEAGGLDVYSYVNVGSAYVRGAEAAASFAFLRWFEAEGSYTFLHAREHGTGLPLPGRAAHQGTFALRFHQRSWGTRAVVRGRVVGRRAYSVDSEAITYADPYASIDLRISQSFLRYLTAFVGVENLLDAGDALANPIAPRSFYGGLTFRY
ncbi:TonB-dependent receptor [Pseudenhygromyxa sp. WMMC2535]|uniref:TonB-dependent receptor plug domain-containing protein n=1 Tax=Pseudenhygromyxa sp. WMMC2535 TaxID=2712867 RepID=UPI0015959DE0|nr:TonB-dependent receptor [Pseudenhygromyxa sp. WMMC2535]NVB39884.1 TonB-dependent receptor [Pseudenhygromyxa sp. WMMC2535]